MLAPPVHLATLKLPVSSARSTEQRTFTESDHNMSPQQNGSLFTLDPDETQEYENVLEAVRGTLKKNPEFGVDYILNALVATGPEELADRIEAWAQNVCSIEPRERAAYCHGNGPVPNRIVPVPTSDELIANSGLFDT